MAQITRAVRGLLGPVAPRRSLLASAIATSMRGFLASFRDSQDPGLPPSRPFQRTTDIAPTIRRRRMSRCPIFEVRPSF